MKGLKRALLMLILVIGSCLISSKSWSQSILKNKQVTQTDVKWLVAIINKQDSLLFAKDLIINAQTNEIKIHEDTNKKLREQISLKGENESLYKSALDITAGAYADAQKKNRKLTFQVKLFKNTSLIIGGAGIATAGYFLLFK